MTKKYTNCPTCGGLCYYPSRNWEAAQEVISAEDNIYKSELQKLAEANARLTVALENHSLKDLSSDVLLELYYKKVRLEEIERIQKNSIRPEMIAMRKLEFDFNKALDEMFNPDTDK